LGGGIYTDIPPSLRPWPQIFVVFTVAREQTETKRPWLAGSVDGLARNCGKAAPSIDGHWCSRLTTEPADIASTPADNASTEASADL